MIKRPISNNYSDCLQYLNDLENYTNDLEIQILKHRINYARLLGEYKGTIKGLLYNKIPNYIKIILEDIIVRLDNIIIN